MRDESLVVHRANIPPLAVVSLTAYPATPITHPAYDSRSMERSRRAEPATRTGSPARPARTCSSTPTTRSTGTRGARGAERARRRQADLPVDRLRGVPLVPRHGARVVRGRGDRDVLNARFVPIKVDREERPDLDPIYMDAVQPLTGSGGWPMSVFLTPDGKPFYGGTYFPAEPRHGLPPSARCSRASTGRGASGAPRSSSRRRSSSASSRRTSRTPRGRRGAARRRCSTRRSALSSAFRRANGGWGGAPKFPQPMTIEFLLRRAAAPATAGPGDGAAHARRDGRRRHLRPARRRLRALRDRRDLARAALREDALRQRPARPRLRPRLAVTGDARYREVADRDARLHGARAHDGRRRVRGEPGRRHRGRGGRDVHLARGRDRTRSATTRRCSRRPTASPTAATGRAGPSCRGSGRRPSWRRCTGCRRPRSRRGSRAARERLLAVARGGRSRRATTRCSRRGTAWRSPRSPTRRGCSRFTPGGEDRRATYRAAAERAADVILGGLLGADGRLGRSWKDGRATGQGVLEDYAHLADGLLALYEATFDERWFVAARALADPILEHFADPAGGFFDTADDHERSSRDRRTSRTTPCRRAARWRRWSCCGSPR